MVEGEENQNTKEPMSTQ